MMSATKAENEMRDDAAGVAIGLILAGGAALLALGAGWLSIDLELAAPIFLVASFFLIQGARPIARLINGRAGAESDRATSVLERAQTGDTRSHMPNPERGADGRLVAFRGRPRD